MIPTSDGETLLQYSRSLLSQIDDIETMFSNKRKKKQTFSISVPRGSYFSSAFSQFSKRLDEKHPAEIIYRETNASRAINNITDADYKLGIIRYAEKYDRYFKEMLLEKGLKGEEINSFSYRILFSKSRLGTFISNQNLEILSMGLLCSSLNSIYPRIFISSVLNTIHPTPSPRINSSSYFFKRY